MAVLTTITPADSFSKVDKTSRQHAGIRARKPKGHTGCVTCRQRRVKCDESKPVCRRCIGARRDCSYSSQALIPQTVAEALAFKSELEKKYFDFAIIDAIKVLVVYKPFITLIWNQVLAQISLAHSQIGHAVVALGAMQSFMQNRFAAARAGIDEEEAKKTFYFALEQQNQAIATAREIEPSYDMMLLFCMLSHCLASWKEKIAAPVVHLRSAQSILLGYDRAVDAKVILKNPFIEHSLRPVIQEFELEAAAFTDELEISRPLHNFFRKVDFDPPTVFRTPLDALVRLERLMKATFCLNYDSKNEDSLLRADVKSAIIKLQQAIEVAIEESTVKCESEYARDMEIFLPHCKVLLIMLDCGRDDTGLSYKKYTEMMGDIATHMERVIDLERQRDHVPGTPMRTSFSAIAPLFFVATCCREEKIRLRALNAMHSSLRRERKLTSCMATALARFVIDQEAIKSASHDGKQMICLEAVQFSRIEKCVRITWRELGDQILQYSTVQYDPKFDADDGADFMQMSRKILKASCYPGTILLRPHVPCHCV